jgi:hypothetical protein
MLKIHPMQILLLLLSSHEVEDGTGLPPSTLLSSRLFETRVFPKEAVRHPEQYRLVDTDSYT